MLFLRWTVRRCSFRCPPAADPGQGLDSVDSLVRILGVAGAIVHLDACVRSSSCSPSKTTVGFQWCVAVFCDLLCAAYPQRRPSAFSWGGRSRRCLLGFTATLDSGTRRYRRTPWCLLVGRAVRCVDKVLE